MRKSKIACNDTPSKNLKAGHNRSASETPFMVARYCVLSDCDLPLLAQLLTSQGYRGFQGILVMEYPNICYRCMYHNHRYINALNFVCVFLKKVNEYDQEIPK